MTTITDDIATIRKTLLMAFEEWEEPLMALRRIELDHARLVGEPLTEESHRCTCIRWSDGRYESTGTWCVVHGGDP
jgi:hypothetical protein